MANSFKVIVAITCLLGFIGFAIFGGSYNWIGFVFAIPLVGLGVFDEMIEDYAKLFRRR